MALTSPVRLLRIWTCSCPLGSFSMLRDFCGCNDGGGWVIGGQCRCVIFCVIAVAVVVVESVVSS
jgi:hypothetical protein